MSNLIEHKKFVAVDVGDNRARFWEYKWYDDDTVAVSYGRLGITRTDDPPKSMTRKKLDTLIKNKTRATKDRPAYVEVPIVGEVASVGTAEKVSKEKLKEMAKAELAGQDPVLIDLVTRLAEANKHELLASTNGAIDIDLSTGIVSTEMGVIIPDSIAKARVLLNDMSQFVIAKDLDNKKYLDQLNQYLSLVPQKAPMHSGWYRSFLYDDAGLQKQNTLLDQLETSVQLVQQRIADAEKGGKKNAPPQPSLFNTKVRVVTDKKVIDEITAFFKKGVNTVHVSSRLKPVRIYEVDIQHMSEAFDTQSKDIPNVMRLWHGSRMFNILSILKSGLKIPPAGAPHVTGRMFADGAYFSDQSTKSLNYSYGYWSGAQDSTCFMFLFDVAMGNFYVPAGPHEQLPKPGYHSTFAKAHQSGVINNEMIVYNLSQCKPRYLVEFAS